MEKYRIMYFLDYGIQYGGAVHTLIQQAAIMKNHGYYVTLRISNYLRDHMEKSYEEALRSFDLDFSYTAFQICTQPEDVDVISIIDNYDIVKSEVQKIRPDILHSVQINPVVELVSRELNIPHIMSVYPLTKDFFGINYLKIFPHYHICDSWYWSKKWSQFLDTESTCIRTVAENKNSGKRNICLEKLDFVCVGNVYKEKNQLGVIKSFEKFLQINQNANLYIYGYMHDSYAKQCIEYIGERGLSDNIHIMGFCADKREIYSDKTAIICGSTRESYPNVISEALSYGLVIISTPVGGVPEVIKDGYNGYLTRDYTIDAIYEKILQFYDDIKDDSIKAIQNCANETFKKTHREEEIFPDLRNFYDKVVIENKHTDHIGIKEMKEKFFGLISLYNRNIDNMYNHELIRLKLWYLRHISPLIHKAIADNKSFYVWGAGNLLKNTLQILDIFFPDVRLSGIIDSYKMDGEILGYKLCGAEQNLLEADNIIFISVYNEQTEIIEKLNASGRIYGKDFFLLAPRRW